MHDIINQLFAARDVAHKLHLKTRSFAKHLALGDLYEGILDKADELAEVWQGQFGVMNDINGNVIDMNQEDPVVFVNQLASWAQSIKQYFQDPSLTHIANIWDELIAIIYRAKYKLENLQ